MRRILNKSSILILATVLFAYSFQTPYLVAQTVERARSGSSDSKAAADTNAEDKRRLETFEIVWQTVNDNYFDQTFSGLNWKQIKAEYLPQVKKTKTDMDLHFLLQKMIDRLNRSHFSIVPPEVYEELEKAKAKVEDGALSDSDVEEAEPDYDSFDSHQTTSIYGIGADVRIFDSQIVITRIDKGSAAEKAGLRTGFIVDEVNGVLLSEFIARIKSYGSFAKSVEKQLPLEIVAWFFNSEEDSEIQLVIRDETETKRVFEFKREKLIGELEKLAPNFPEQFLQFEARSIDEDIGYIKFNQFTVSMIEKICNAISEFKTKKSLIIDLRGNLGGSYGSVIGLGGFFTKGYIPLGTEITKRGPTIRLIKPHKKNFNGRVVVLIDRLSYSAAEIFAAGLQENGKATVIGEISAGEALPSVTKTLPTGAVFLYPIANFKSPNGNLLEGNGVVPNISVPLKRDSLLKNKDDQLESAISFFKEKGENPANLSIRKEILGEPDPPPPPKPVFRGPRPTANAIPKVSGLKPLIQQPKALKIIDDSVAAMGGEQAFRAVNSYSATGNSTLFEAGTEINGKIEIYRQSPDKWAEIMSIEGIGEFREVFDGKKYFVQSEVFGTDQPGNSVQTKEVALLADFYELLNVRDIFPAITYRGEFDREGSKVHLIEATSNLGSQVIFVFEVSSKMLVNRTGSTSVISFGDYRKIGEILYPFWQSRTDALIYKFTEVKLNEKIDSKVFEVAESCFDKID